MDDFTPGIYEYKGHRYMVTRRVYGAGELRGEKLVYYVPLYQCDLPCFVRFADDFAAKFTLVKALRDDDDDALRA